MIMKRKKELVPQTINEAKGHTKPIEDIITNRKKKENSTRVRFKCKSVQ